MPASRSLHWTKGRRRIRWGNVSSVTICGAAHSYSEHKPDFKPLEIVFRASTKLIDIMIFEERRDVSVPSSLQFQYKPSLGFAPIHEIAEGRNTHIKEFY